MMEKLLQPTGGLLSWSSQAPPTNKNMTAVKKKMGQLPLTKLAKKHNSPLKYKTKPTGKKSKPLSAEDNGFLFLPLSISLFPHALFSVEN